MTDNLFLESVARNSTPIALVTKSELEGWLEEQGKTTANWVNNNGFTASEASHCVVPGRAGKIAHILAGLGEEVSPESLLATMGGLAESLQPGKYHLETDLAAHEADLAAIGWAQGGYQFDFYGKPGKERPQLTWPEACHREPTKACIDGAALTRTLVDVPANDMGPEELQDAALKLAEQFEAEHKIILDTDLLDQNFPAIYEVGKGSDRRPRLINLEWGDPKDPRVALVGKGVCFDTGGYNLKPGGAMALMKKDMGGAAHVLGLAHMIMANKLPVRLQVLIPAVENSVSGNAFRPGDIIKSRKGSDIEIGNTDAEGRLVLSDALTLACEQKPELIIDFATLTGAARSALGPDVPPFYTDDSKLARCLADQATYWADPLWRLPLWKSYNASIKGTLGDIRNDGGPFAGSITAALFLQHFVEPNTKWAHLDIYAWNPNKRPGRVVGAAAQCLRTVYGAICETVL